MHKYVLNGVELEHVFEEKDLEVIIDSELKLEDEAEKVKKANITTAGLMGLKQSSLSHLNSRVFKTLFGFVHTSSMHL